MSDYSSELPVRSNLPGQVDPDDIIVKIGDAANPTTQLLGVDSAGRVTVKLDDSAGNGITSVTNGAHQALDVWSQSNGPVSPGTVAAFSDLIGGQYNVTLPTLTDTQQSAIQVDSHGRLLVSDLSTDDHNYGVVGANTLRTAAQIGNATGAADFNFGTVGAQTLRVAAELGNAGGALDYNFGGPTAQTLRVAAELGNATGAIDYNFGTVGAQTVRTAAQIGNATGAASFNYGAVTAQTLRVASQIGNATGAADFNAGATTAQTLRVVANINDATGTPFSATNPLPVTVDTVSGTAVDDYKDASSVAKAATDNHDYTVTAGKTFFFNEVIASASGKLKMVISVETGVATGVFTTKFVQFSSTADTNANITLTDAIAVAAGVRVRVALTNLDNQAQDLYSTICGHEI